MKVRTIAIIAAAFLALIVQSTNAVASVGYNHIVIPASSDARLSVPFNQNIEGTYTVDNVTISGVTVTDVLVGNAFADSYYVRFIDGNGEGLWSTISSNGTGNFDIADLNVLNYVSIGDTFRVYKHHTLSSVFPKGMYGKSFTNGTKVLIYENNIDVMSQNKAAVKSATYTTAAGGKWVGAGINNNTILEPDTQFIFRNNTAQSFELITLGDVPDYSVSRLIAADGDLIIGTGYPVAVVLKDSGLGGNNLRKVLFYDNTASGQNKAAVKTATYTTAGGGKWVGSGITGNELINPSESITFRLPSSEVYGSKVTIKKPY